MIRNVLVIAYYFPPMGLSGVQRTTKFVKYLPDYDWNPIVLTHTPINYYAFDDSLSSELETKDITIYRTDRKKAENLEVKRSVSKFPSYFVQKAGQNLIQSFYQPDSKIKWLKKAIELGEKIIKDNEISAIFATAPPFTDFLVASELSKKFNIPFIVDYRDVWTDNPYHFYLTPFHKNYSVGLESEILTHAKRAIVTTRKTKEILLRRYKFLSHEDIVIISHGYDEDDFTNYRGVENNNKKFIITHSGVFQDNRNPKYFLKALSNFLKNHKDASDQIEARFVGVMRKNHLKYIKKFGLDKNVVCTGYLEHKEAVKNLVESDVLWLTQNDDIRSPGKLYEYFGAGKPIIVCIPDGGIRRQALESKSTIACDPDNIKAIEQAIGSFYKLWKNHNLPSPTEQFINQFNRQKLSGDLARELSLASEL